MIQRVFVIRRIGADAGGFAISNRRIIIGRDQTRRTIAADLQRQLPTGFHRLADHRGQQRHLSDQAFDQRWVIVLGQNFFKCRIQTRDAPPNIGRVKLKWQDGIVPSNFAGGHGLSLHVRNWHTAPI